jgi:hypothetical protein
MRWVSSFTLVYRLVFWQHSARSVRILETISLRVVEVESALPPYESQPSGDMANN